jgi:hypothetical protein
MPWRAIYPRCDGGCEFSFLERIPVTSCVPEEVPAFLWAETVYNAIDPTQKARNGALSRSLFKHVVVATILNVTHCDTASSEDLASDFK